MLISSECYSGQFVHVINLFDFVFFSGSKTFQERCERIRNILQDNGIEGEPTMSKCKQLKKQLKLNEEMAGLDPSVIIDSKDEHDGRPKRTTRTATRRNYVYNETDETNKSNRSSSVQDGLASNLLEKMKDFIDSDSEYEADEHSQNGNNNISSNSNSEYFGNESVTPILSNGTIVDSSLFESDSEQTMTENSTQVITNENQSSQASEPAQCTLSVGQV